MQIAPGRRDGVTVGLGRRPRAGRSPRIAHRSRCTLRSRDSIGQLVSETGETINISPEGLAVQLARPLEPGALVEVEMGGEPIAGRVAHSRRVSTGTFEIGISLETPRRT